MKKILLVLLVLFNTLSYCYIEPSKIYAFEDETDTIESSNDNLDTQDNNINDISSLNNIEEEPSENDDNDIDSSRGSVLVNNTMTTSSNYEKVKGEYFISNNTGKNIDGVYFYEAGSADKGTNYVEAAYNAGEMHYNYIQNFHAITVNAEDDEKFAEITINEGDTKPSFTFEVTVDGETYAVFENLILEVADIVLIPTESIADYGNGATQIAWGKDFADGYTMTVNFYNSTGYDITSLKAYNSETGEQVADILSELGIASLSADDTDAHPWAHSEDIRTADTIHYLIEWEMSNGETLTLGRDDTHTLSFENTAMQLLNSASIPDYNNGATTVVWLSPNITPVTPVVDYEYQNDRCSITYYLNGGTNNAGNPKTIKKIIN